ncbi:L-histidine N(alpha)-methyltransferase [Gilvimarinus polysaccharolyticus]|uniref:L-histidine N(alpha)-methyltransferase n=1 Tax=Gilvimarinus polysaccharolyticus TaxID=863921 RepID=UPI00067363C9|nr:L-histidine N(alpha)-methyltransferase [Gilvimarinus polysaccharolyticus]
MTTALATDKTKPATAPQNQEFLADVLSGLALQQKQLAPKYFYDERGSQLFDDICALDEYYPYHVELDLLPKVAAELSHFFHTEQAGDLSVVEFGAGSLRKITPLLKRINTVKNLTAIDISQEHLLNSCAELRHQFKHLDVTAKVHDFTQPLSLDKTGLTRMGFFPGSTIGNFDRIQALDFLRSAGQTLGNGAYLLIGVDTKKPNDILHHAYNDAQGVTAQFNKNILTRINRELEGNFELQHFAHHAFYNPDQGRIEMHLRSLREQHVRVADHEFYFAKNESIHTENSYKYHAAEFTDLAQKAHWYTRQVWMAPNDLFAISLLQHQPSNASNNDC